MNDNDISLNDMRKLSQLKIANENLKNLEDTAKKITSTNQKTNSESIEIENVEKESVELGTKESPSSLSEIQNLNSSLRDFGSVFKTSIEKFLDYQSKRDEEVKGKDAISRGDVKTKKYINYYDRNFTIPVATAADPNDFDSSIYAGNSSTTFITGAAVGRVEVFTELERYSDTIYVANDGTDTLFVIISHGGKTNFSKEAPIYPGEVKCYHYVYELRFRSPTSGLPYRVSEYCLNKLNTGTTVGGVFTPIEKGVIHNVALPLVNTDLFATALSPTNTPTLFRVMVAMSVVGNFNATITRGGSTMIVTLNPVPGPALVADGLYIFDILVHSGDTVNFQYSATGGMIHVIRIQEIDAAVT